MAREWNSRTLVCVENFPQLFVQTIFVYLQGARGFTVGLGDLGTDLGLHLGQTSKRDGVQMIDTATAVSGVLISTV
jgi:hypothetical protein